MEKIASFTVNHLKLVPGIYVSRKDTKGDTTVTTFDIRMTSPNEEDFICCSSASIRPAMWYLF